MAAPPAGFPPFVPPLPPGWSEHQAPGGQTYYYHSASNQSTYVRPIPAVIPGAAPKKKKERPQTKTLVPGTSWLRVTTTEGNVFWTHKERKESLWEMPDEIKDQVAAMESEAQEKVQREAAEQEHREREEKERENEKHVQEEQEEVQRVMDEVKDAVKRKAEEPAEDGAGGGRKKPRVENADDEEALQREMTEEMAAEEAEGSHSPQERKEDAETVPATEVYASSPLDDKAPGFTVPDRVDLSLDEAKALFKTLLQEKEVNPLHPWDKSLPKFINDPRYVLLPSVSARRDAFDEYCRDAVRAQRLARAAAQKEEAGDDPNPDRAAYSRLLREEVTSTRTTWNEFRRRWKKDRRYFGWAGERERERAFRDWVKGLGEVKRKAAEKAEREFFQLLREHKEITPDAVWKDAKRKIDPKDPRYDAVGSSSLREELFGTYIKTLDATKSAEEKADGQKEPDANADGPLSDDDAGTRRRQRAERAERGRAETVRRERAGLERELGRTRGTVGREEGEREFNSLLTDAVRDPQATWDGTAPQLAHDPRFVLCALPASTQRALFAAHVARLQTRPRSALHALFAAHAPGLGDTLSDDARATIRASAPAKKLGLDEDGDDNLDAEFSRWQRTRGTEAREEFNKMLGENAFLEFWGRMGKAEGKGLDDGAVEGEEEEGEEGEGGGGRADLKRLAKSVDVDEVGKVLKSDSRWTAFDYVPEQRERWLRGYMEHLSAPKLSVHVPET